MEYLDFEKRWLKAGGAERANYSLFLQDLCDLLAVPRPEPTTDRPAQDAYVLERAVTFDDGGGHQSIGRIDLYKRGCFVLETKQGVSRLDEVLGDYKKRTAREESSENIDGTSRDFTGLHGTSRDFTGLHGTSRDFTGLHGTSRDQLRLMRSGLNWA